MAVMTFAAIDIGSYEVSMKIFEMSKRIGFRVHSGSAGYEDDLPSSRKRQIHAGGRSRYLFAPK